MPEREVDSIWCRTGEEVIAILVAHLKDRPAHGQPIDIALPSQEIRVDPWEIDCIHGSDPTSKTISMAVALRAQTEDLLRAFKVRDSFPFPDVERLLKKIPEVAKDSWSIEPDLHSLEETADGPLRSKYRLTGQKMARSVGTLLTAFEDAGFPIPSRESSRKPRRSQSRRPARSSETPRDELPSAPSRSRQRRGLIALCLLLPVLAATIALAVRQRGPRQVPLDTNIVGDLLPLEKLWVRGETAFGVLESHWFSVTDEDKEAVLLKANHLLGESYPIKKLALYQPNGRLLAAVVEEDTVTLFPLIAGR